MNSKESSNPEHMNTEVHDENRIHKWVGRTLLAIVAIEWLFLLLDARWLLLFLVTIIMAVLVFRTVPLTATEWLRILVASSLVVLVVEIDKLVRRQGRSI